MADQRRPGRWTKYETDQLKALAGSVTAREIAKSIQRSVQAVYTRAKMVDAPLTLNDWSLERMCELFGIHPHTARLQWLNTGLLPSRYIEAIGAAANGTWRIRDADLENFIISHPWEYDPDKLFPSFHRLAQLGKRIHQRDPWLTYDQATAYSGYSHTTLFTWTRKGLIPVRRRHVGKGSVGGIVVMRQRDLDLAIERMSRRSRAA